MTRARSIEEYHEQAAAAKGKPARIRRYGAPYPTEHDEQVALFQWAGKNLILLPELRLLHAIPNAGAGAQAGQAGKMKAEGVKPGVPDICLPVPRNGRHGLYIELKRIGGAPTVAQLQWLDDLHVNGYVAVWCQGFTAARNEILLYLTGRRPT